MKAKLPVLPLLLCIAVAVYSCSKSGSNYSTTDHTVGMIKIRPWSGYSSGFNRGDTLYSSLDTHHVAWPKAYYRTITDTSVSVVRDDGFTVSMLGVVMRYRTTDSTLKYIRFDSTSSASTGILLYFFGNDSMHFEYHLVTGFNDTAKQYYQVNEFLHSP